MLRYVQAGRRGFESLPARVTYFPLLRFLAILLHGDAAAKAGDLLRKIELASLSGSGVSWGLVVGRVTHLYQAPIP